MTTSETLDLVVGLDFYQDNKDAIEAHFKVLHDCEEDDYVTVFKVPVTEEQLSFYENCINTPDEIVQEILDTQAGK